MSATLSVALVTEVFHDDPEGQRLGERLTEARRRGAELAVLPELPLNAWAPATRTRKDIDAEPVDGPRQETLARAARTSDIAVLGGAIIREPVTGIRHNTALLYAADGSCLTRYRKVHLPEEEGYWETSHYEAGSQPPSVVEGLSLRIGIQICSDVNRPQGFQILAAQGARVVLAPRATPPETYDRWRLVLRANAIMSSTYVVSANRPGPERGASIGGPSLIIDPAGEIVAETTEPLHVARLDEAVLQRAGQDYPGYLKRFPGLYARGWSGLET